MNFFKIKGGHPLKGTIIPQGSKNEALQVISAVLLTSEIVKINNVPHIYDVKLLIQILESFGVKCKMYEKSNYLFCSKNINLKYFSTKNFDKQFSCIRGSIMILGPILARFGYIKIPFPGGDKIGKRHLDTHFNAFSSLGVSYNYDKEKNEFSLKAPEGGLKGNYVLLEEPSITGTANIIMTAVLAKGKTIIYNAACEPYIQQLCRMLNSMGAKIYGIGSNLITIFGVDILRGCTHSILPDIIEIGSWIGLAAITKSEIIIKNVNWRDLGIIPNAFRKLGVMLYKFNQDDIFIPEQKYYKIQNFIDGSMLTLYDSPWPGLSPDLLSILLVTAIQAQGSVLIHQKMFESRLFFVDILINMGAKIILCDPHRAIVIGLNRKRSLKSSIMTSPDIRAGVSLLIAALSAEGISKIYNIEQIDRGYENIDFRLNTLGAHIIRFSK